MILAWNWCSLVSHHNLGQKKNVVRTLVTLLAYGSKGSCLFLPCFEVIRTLSEYTPAPKWNLFVKKHRSTNACAVAYSRMHLDSAQTSRTSALLAYNLLAGYNMGMSMRSFWTMIPIEKRWRVLQLYKKCKVTRVAIKFYQQTSSLESANRSWDILSSH